MEKLKPKQEMDTLVTCMKRVTDAGFVKQFKADENGLKEISSGKIYVPENIKVLNFYRFEGNSDPADNAILYAIETDDGVRGTLVDAFGPYSDSKVTVFMKKVQEIHKKTRVNGIL